MAMIIRPLIIAVTDPGEGPRGEGATPTPYFQTILMPDGPKKIFGKRPSPLSQGLDDHFPSPPPPNLSSQALDPALYGQLQKILKHTIILFISHSKILHEHCL